MQALDLTLPRSLLRRAPDVLALPRKKFVRPAAQELTQLRLRLFCLGQDQLQRGITRNGMLDGLGLRRR